MDIILYDIDDVEELDCTPKISQFIQPPKTPSASQIIRIEKGSDLQRLFSDTGSPNQDGLLFGNLSLSRVSLPNRRHSMPTTKCRRSIAGTH